MKKIFVLLCILVPFGLQAQILGKHHIEPSVGLAVPGDLLYEQGFSEKTHLNLSLAYRYDISNNLSVGAQYSFVPTHSGLTKSEETQIDLKTNYHSIDALVEYKMLSGGAVNFFAGIGGGVQGRYTEFPGRNIDPGFWWGPDFNLYLGVEIQKHLRVTLGHHHDLHFPFKSLSFSAAPYYYLNLGWSF